MLEVSCNTGKKEEDTYFEVTKGRDDLSLFGDEPGVSVFEEVSGKVTKEVVEQNKQKSMKYSMKNIRQVGEVSGNTKLYIEDQVIHFLERIKNKIVVPLLFLGYEEYKDGKQYVYLTGMIFADGIQINGNRLEFDTRSFERLEEEKKLFFGECAPMGWFLPSAYLVNQYASVLEERGKIFGTLDEEDEIAIHMLRNGRIEQLRGYYVFYGANEAMRKYTVARKLDIEAMADQVPQQKLEMEQVHDDEFVDDYEREQENMEESTKLTTFLYAASTVLAIVVLVIGITLVNNYEKMYQLQDSVNTIVSTLQGAELYRNAAHEEVAEANADAALMATSIPTMTPVATEEASVKYYTIQKGDTLVSISRKLYNTEERIDDICTANGITREQELVVGKTLIIP